MLQRQAARYGSRAKHPVKEIAQVIERPRRVATQKSIAGEPGGPEYARPDGHAVFLQARVPARFQRAVCKKSQAGGRQGNGDIKSRSEEHTFEHLPLMRNSSAVSCLKKKK